LSLPDGLVRAGGVDVYKPVAAEALLARVLLGVVEGDWNGSSWKRL
jgi:hypothetical protein